MAELSNQSQQKLVPDLTALPVLVCHTQEDKVLYSGLGGLVGLVGGGHKEGDQKALLLLVLLVTPLLHGHRRGCLIGGDL